ncbi:hypothetical protein K449DRAFT_438962 [Hypoxylon sp. EC38]|nr:hypothetical protein K449DRAFT_438962 [Hypoxylon sp. EC38]
MAGVTRIPEFAGTPNIRQVILNQARPETKIAPDTTQIPMDGVIIAWNLPWNIVMDIHRIELNLGRLIFFDQGYIHTFCEWPTLTMTPTTHHTMGTSVHGPDIVSTTHHYKFYSALLTPNGQPPVEELG